MRKSTLFVSAMLTVFLMATIFGVVSAYQQVVKNSSISPDQAMPKSQKVAVMAAPAASAPAAPLIVTAEEATAIAMDFLGDTNVYSVEVVDYQGAPTYLVTFSSGDLVYVSSAGVVIANEKLQPVYVASNSGNGGGNNGNNNGGDSSDDGGNSGGGDDDDHEEREDHEEHEDDDD